MTTVPQANPIGVHALVWAGDTSPGSLAYAIEKTKATGFDLLELSLHDSDSLDVPAARRRLEDAGLAVACSRGLAFDADVSSDDLAVVERGEHLLHSFLAVTHGLGGTHFTGALYSALGKYAGPVTEAGRRNAVTVLKRLAQEAAGLVHALADIGYRGPITFESFSSAVVAPGLSNDLAVWRDLWSDGEDLARHAHTFITNQLAVSGRPGR